MISYQRTNTHVPGTSGHRSLGLRPLRPLRQVSLSDAGRTSLCPSGFGVLSQSTVSIAKLSVLSTWFGVSVFTTSYYFHGYLLKLWLFFSAILFYHPLRLGLGFPAFPLWSCTFLSGPGFHLPCLCIIFMPCYFCTLRTCSPLYGLLFGTCIWTKVWHWSVFSLK